MRDIDIWDLKELEKVVDEFIIAKKKIKVSGNAVLNVTQTIYGVEITPAS